MLQVVPGCWVAGVASCPGLIWACRLVGEGHPLPPKPHPPTHSSDLLPLPYLYPACSQTIFTMRAGVYNRWNGVVVALSEAVMFALPFAGGSSAVCLVLVVVVRWLRGRLRLRQSVRRLWLRRPLLVSLFVREDCCTAERRRQARQAPPQCSSAPGCAPPFLPPMSLQSSSTCPTSSTAACCSGLASRSRETG